MTLWFTFALMTAAAAFAVLWPLRRDGPAASTGNDLEVYRDQLAEIERDRSAGAITDEDAEAARIEVSRRLIAAADAGHGPAPAAKEAGPRRAVALAALLALPAGVFALYLNLGSPALPGQPLAARLDRPGEQRSLASLVAQVEIHLERNPNDGQGWEVIAPVYARIGRIEDLVKARRNALNLLGATADRQAAYGEALVIQANGVVTQDAKAAFERALGHEPGEPKASYYLGLSAEQDRNKADAARIWRALLDRSPPNAPWVPLVREALSRIGAPAPTQAQAPAAPAAPAPGPSAADVEAAQQMSAEDRNAMIRGMVTRLADRLKTDRSDPDAWARLIRAYMVLGERDKAKAALADARAALEPAPEQLQKFNDAIRPLGVDG